MINALDGLVEELRRVGIAISVSEKIDAVRALKYVDLGNRDAVKTALGAVLVKNAEHELTYETIFDLYFANVVTNPADGSSGDPDETGSDEGDQPGDGSGSGNGPGDGHGGGSGGGSGGVLDSLDDAGIHQLLIRALESDQQTLLRSLAAAMVERHAGMQPGRQVAGTYYLFRTMRAVDPDRVLSTLIERATGRGSGPPDPLGERLLNEEYRRRVAAFQQEVEAEIRRRLVADRGADDVARTLRKPLPEDVDFLTASGLQITELRAVIEPISRRLASRLATKRRHNRRGTLDFRRTVRQAMSTGGVPLTPLFHKPRPHKPELFILADISGSVSTFAGFTLQLTYALRSQFSKVRSFVFVDGIDDVTQLLADANNITDATKRINSEGRGVWLDGRSDYGNAFETFWDRFGAELRSRSTVLILGDARNNYHASRAAVVKRMRQHASHVYWLNPERVSSWNSGDSVMREYAPFCDGVFEVRNIRQLREFIEQLG